MIKERIVIEIDRQDKEWIMDILRQTGIRSKKELIYAAIDEYVVRHKLPARPTLNPSEKNIKTI